MLRKKQGNLEWLEFELLASFPKLKHAVCLRHGGISQGPFNSLNLSNTMGDNPSHVEANLEKVKSVLQIEQLAAAEQVHSDGIIVVNKQNYRCLKQHDALMTHWPELGLKISHADCQAAILYDPIKHALAVVHCGWRGHVCNIYAKAIGAMFKTYGSNPADIHVGISPSLGPCHAEFVNYRTEFPEHFWQFQVKENHFDLWNLAIWQLKKVKVLESRIQVAQICTYANEVDYFSYRRSQRVTGAHGTIAVLL